MDATPKHMQSETQPDPLERNRRYVARQRSSALIQLFNPN